MKSLFNTNKPTAAKTKVKWNFLPKAKRGLLMEINNTVKKIGNAMYQLGPYKGTLDELKEFARTRQIESLKMGCINIKL